MASLFGKNKLREVASRLSTSELEDKIAIVKTWHNDYHNGSLKKDKETSREQAYNQDFFIKILGYKEKPAVPYSLEPKATTEKGQFPDAVLSYTDKTKDIGNITAVIELKGAIIELDRPQRRDGNMSPVQQGFKYKTQYRNCPFVIVSNFWEFRLYNDNQLDYELWTLDDLVDPADDYLQFKTFYYLLQNENFTAPKGTSKTEDLLTDIRIQQETIGKKFYKVYHNTRLTLLRDIYARNSFIKTDIDTGIEKAQKIIDRIVFACFAEDRGLLPDNTLQRVVKAADSSTFGGSLWSTFKGFFEAIDVGSIKLEIADGYNGGLFARDDVLNNLEIGDDALRSVASLSTYNFNEDLSVNILGHIFEQSISDLEEIKNKVNESQSLGSLGQSRRKKDGIFYTPDYIVRYIVENSLGGYLREHEETFKEEFKLHGDIKDKTYSKREQLAYGKYQDFLQNVKVLDPACGSGAFLVHVFDYLLAENKRVNSILGNSLFSSDDYVKSILQNNIYGVDLNEESVEITKLSLWLKTAQKGNKLTALDQNIKCGNSLISDPVIAGEKAFNWKTEFAQIMDKGGFDVVVMNPPYVKEAAGKEIFAGLHDNPYYQGKMDLWYLFGALALDIVKQNSGIIGLIAPSNWITNDGASKFRNKVISEATIERFIDFGDFKVFAEAGIQTMVMIMTSNRYPLEYSAHYSKVIDSKIEVGAITDFLNGISEDRFIHFTAQIDRTKLLDQTITFVDSTNDELLKKIVQHGIFHLDAEEISSGIDIGQDFISKKSNVALGDTHKIGEGVFNLSNDEFAALNPNPFERALLKPFFTTRQVNRYLANAIHNLWVIYADSRFQDPEMMRSYPNIKKHLDQFQDIITSANKPYGLHRARNEQIFKGEKILSVRKCLRPSFSYVSFDSYVNRTFLIIKTARIDLQYLTAILNSKLIAYWLRKRGKLQGDLYQIDIPPLTSLPIAVASDQSELANLAQQMGELTLLMAKSDNRFQKLVAAEFGLDNLPSKLKNWWNLDFISFSSGFKLTLNQKDELIQLFDKYQTKCQQLVYKLQSIDKEIDQLVYRLYELSDEDISIIETVVK